MMTRVKRLVVWAFVAALVWPWSIGAARQSDLGASEIKLDKEKFGVGGVVRPGEWIGLRVQFTDSASKQREIVLRAVVEDSDGDRVFQQREVTANPGVKQGTWLYLRLPSWFQFNDPITLEAYEAVIEKSGSAQSGTISASGFSAGKLLGRTTITPQGFISAANGLIGVIGPKAFGLTRYGLRMNNEDYAPLGHEITDVESGLTPADLPDRWMGLMPFEVIVWGAGDPGVVRGDHAAAVREWVTRGGHLVIVLPAAGENWTNPGANELHDLLPRVTVTRREGVDLNQYRRLLTFPKPGVGEKLLPTDAVVHEFTPVEGATAGEASRILNGPEGNCVVARRLVGTGAVTLVGLDLGHRLLADADAIEPAVLWNRVLGRRGRAESQVELDGRQRSGGGRASRAIAQFDTDIAPQIARTQNAAAGVLLGFVVFLLYWAVAGPGGYAVLKKKGLVRHAWVSFVLAAGAFTVIAWGGAEAIRPKRVLGTHLTFLDHVYGQPVERARVWMSLLVPWYGNARVSVGDPKPASGPRPERIDLIAPWEPPPAEGGTIASFPDSRGYVVDPRAPNSMVIPTRQTVKQLRMDWAGGPPWKMPIPVSDADGKPGVIRLRENHAAGEGWVDGTLRHELPGSLFDVVIVIVPPQQPLETSNGNLANQLIANAKAFSLGEWKSGDEGILDLYFATSTKASTNVSASEKLSSLLNSGKSEQYMAATRPTGRVEDRLTALAFFSQLQPPELGDRVGESIAIARRLETHGWDLGRWFTQPCLIVVGMLGTSDDPKPSPVPVFVNGEPIRTEGRTVVRWVYPLPDSPPPYKRPGGDEAGSTPESGAGN